MPDPFDSAKRKLAWGRKRITELERETEEFFKETPCEAFAEPHPDIPEYTVHKIRLARRLPEDIPMIAGDAVDNLRAALDHAVYATAFASGRAKIANAFFPFAGSAARFESQLKGRCADVPIEIWPCLRAFKPYKGGNNLLVALNQACNSNKHALIVGFAMIVDNVSAKMRATGGFVSIPTVHIWNRAKNEMELFTEGPGVQRNGEFDFRSLVALSEVPGCDSEQAFRVLDAFSVEVERVINALEAESRRLGFIQ
jgi:hypothetical protein